MIEMMAKMMLKTVIWIAFVIMASSCNHADSYKEEIARLQSRPISLPLSRMQATYEGKDTTFVEVADGIKLIVYSDSASCNSCALSKIHFWNDLLDEIRLYGERLNVYFIFSPSTEELANIRLSLSASRFYHPIYVDTSGIFIRENPHLPHNPLFHTFLLDEDNRVVLVGNPLENVRIEELFWKIVKERLGERH